MNNLIKLVEDEMKTASKEFPLFAPGDIITVEYRIREGNKERIQNYRGTVIAIKGHGSKRRFNVRKISDGVAVERIFPLDSPFVENIRVERHGKVRRAKLYYLRALRGKSARIKERRFLSKSVKRI
ncbi:ribosomal protein L19 [Bacteroidales bacterium KA00251]|nr:ribosomal protein L19 [Bacteroidales bacterium KA00251]